MIKKLIRLTAVFLIVTLTFGSTVFTSYAQENNRGYEEIHKQIDFDNLSVCVKNKDELVVEVDKSVSIFKRMSGKREKKKYDEFIERHADSESLFLDYALQGDNLVVFAYTEAPLEERDGNLQRVRKANGKLKNLFVMSAEAANTKVGETYKKENFTLCTVVIREGTKNPYTYTALTYGTWSKHAITLLNGKKYPASGTDWILQSCPEKILTDELEVLYNHNVANNSASGREGKEFWSENGGDQYIRYGLKDDPLGMAQLDELLLMTTFEGNSSSIQKKINSYYVHTWKQMSLSVSVQGTAAKDPSVSLELTPGIEEKSWQIYSYVAYNF